MLTADGGLTTRASHGLIHLLLMTVLWGGAHYRPHSIVQLSNAKTARLGGFGAGIRARALPEHTLSGPNTPVAPGQPPRAQQADGDASLPLTHAMSKSQSTSQRFRRKVIHTCHHTCMTFERFYRINTLWCSCHTIHYTPKSRGTSTDSGLGLDSIILGGRCKSTNQTTKPRSQDTEAGTRRCEAGTLPAGGSTAHGSWERERRLRDGVCETSQFPHSFKEIYWMPGIWQGLCLCSVSPESPAHSIPACVRVCVHGRTHTCGALES